MENHQQINQIHQPDYPVLLLGSLNKTNRNKEKKMEQKKISKSKIFGIIIAVFAVLLVALSGMLMEDADKSKNYVCQMPMTGIV